MMFTVLLWVQKNYEAKYASTAYRWHLTLFLIRRMFLEAIELKYTLYFQLFGQKTKILFKSVKKQKSRIQNSFFTKLLKNKPARLEDSTRQKENLRKERCKN